MWGKLGKKLLSFREIFACSPSPLASSPSSLWGYTGQDTGFQKAAPPLSLGAFPGEAHPEGAPPYEFVSALESQTIWLGAGALHATSQTVVKTNSYLKLLICKMGQKSWKASGRE